MQFDLADLTASAVLDGDFLWPNELTRVQLDDQRSAMLVPDGFLMPGQSDGALYLILNIGTASAKPIKITSPKKGWFYHRAVFVTLPTGQKGVITARANKPLFGEGRGELVWLAVPDDLGEPSNLESGETPKPWKETVLAVGPDVIFEVMDLDKRDDSIELVAAHFFGRKLSVYSISGRGKDSIEIEQINEMETSGRPYGLCLARFPVESDQTTATSQASIQASSTTELCSPSNPSDSAAYDVSSPTHILVSTHECSYDVPGALSMAFSSLTGKYPRIKTGDYGSGLRPGEKHTVENGPGAIDTENGGSLFAYAIPGLNEAGKNIDESGAPFKEKKEKTRPSIGRGYWERKTLFRGFKVRGWGGIFSPGAPGFPYVFKMPHEEEGPPLILLAGDCTGSAYVFSPVAGTPCADFDSSRSTVPPYELAFEVQCGATVGSASVTAADDGSGDVDVYIPSYELNKVHVFRMSDRGGK
jgi:hypothetical protein